MPKPHLSPSARLLRLSGLGKALDRVAALPYSPQLAQAVGALVGCINQEHTAYVVQMPQPEREVAQGLPVE